MRTENLKFNVDFLQNGLHSVRHTLTGWYQTAKDIFTDEVPFFIEAEKEADYQHFQAWRSDLRQTLRVDRRAIENGGVDIRLFREKLLAHPIHSLKEIVSPFYYQQQLTALEEKLKQQLDPVIPTVFL